MDYIVFHHLGYPVDDSYSPYNLLFWEMKNGEYDLDYHYVIMKDGTILEGRDIKARGAHADGSNTGKIGILFFSNHDINDDKLTEAQVSAATDLTLYLNYRYKINYVVGHRDINADICPGDLAMPTVLELDTLIQMEKKGRTN